MLSDKLQHVKSPKRRKKEQGVRRWYSDSEKFEAVKLWLITGNLPVVSASLNIPLPTLKEWRYSKWWDELVLDIKSEKTLQLSNRLKTIAEKALDITLDRLENGDWFYDQKTGEVRRKPVVMRDAMQVANGFLDRHVNLEKKPFEEKAQQQVQDRLLALADAFANMAKKTKKIEVIDAIYDERQARLQEGVALGEDESQASGLGSSETGAGSSEDGEGDGGYAVIETRGSQEGSEERGIEFSEQSTVDISESKSK